MKKYRNRMFLSAFLLAVCSSFAFTNQKHQDQIAFYNDELTGCTQTDLEDDSCAPFNGGAICTVTDPWTHNATTAYASDLDNNCLNPYRLPF